VRALVALAFLVLLLVALLPAIRGAWRRPRPLRRRSDELVKDPVCQTYVVQSRAVRLEGRGAPVYFCSRECAERYRPTERRA
jgi:YHS domain-containing protein